MNLEFLESEKSKIMLAYEGYLYHIDKKTETKEIWRCCDLSCKGHCNTANETIIKPSSEHSHAASFGQLEKLEFDQLSNDVQRNQKPQQCHSVSVGKFGSGSPSYCTKNRHYETQYLDRKKMVFKGGLKLLAMTVKSKD